MKQRREFYPYYSFCFCFCGLISTLSFLTRFFVSAGVKKKKKLRERANMAAGSRLAALWLQLFVVVSCCVSNVSPQQVQQPAIICLVSLHNSMLSARHEFLSNNVTADVCAETTTLEDGLQTCTLLSFRSYNAQPYNNKNI